MRILEVISADSPDENYRFTEEDIREVFKHFLDRLEHEHGNDREGMFKYHLEKLIGKRYRDILKIMPRGPKGRWSDLMADVRAELKGIACNPMHASSTRKQDNSEDKE